MDSDKLRITIVEKVTITKNSSEFLLCSTVIDVVLVPLFAVTRA